MDMRERLDKLPAKIIGLSNSDYRALREFASRSYLYSVAQQGGEAQLWMDQGRSLFGGNSATSKGSDFDAIIEGILGGKQFDAMVAVAPDDVLGANGSRSTKAYKEWAAAQTGICCTADQMEVYERMYASMLNCEAAHQLMQQTNETQVSVFFEINGHKVKVRPDACTPDLWWDLKTTSSTWDRLFRSVIDYGYAEQAWLYTEGAKAIGYSQFRMPFVFVSTQAPYACRVFHLPEDLVEEAGRQMVSVLEEVALRRSTGMYAPADSGEINELEVPAWARRKEEVVLI
jgi:hypothetical protein